MKILLAQNLIHLPSHGGANRSNRLLLEQLAADGHSCHVVGPLTGALATHTPATAAPHTAAPHTPAGPGTPDADPAVAALRARGAVLLADDPDAVVYRHRGVTVHAVRSARLLPGRIRAVAAELDPDRTLVPSDDPGLVALSAALAATPGRVVYLVHTLQQLPFGPGAFYPSEAGTRMVRRAAGVLAVSRAAQEYVRAHAGLSAHLIHPQVYGPGPFPARGAFGRGAVTMVNPCGYKGLPILLGLADTLPDVPFLAVPTWGTEPEELAELRRRPNITLTDPVDDIDELLRCTSVLLMPSLWDETFGYSCVEAMLRGIPVLASALGGLVEAKLGVPGSLPVRPVTGYAARAGQARPTPLLPPQDLAPWRAALLALLTDPDHYRDQAEASRAAAGAFVAGIDPGAFGRWLAELAVDAPPRPAAEGPLDRAAALRLLAARRAARRPAPAAPDREEPQPC
ncbi:glycosyltransferase family 4 protein [Streptomyces sp. NPDC092296]|uniref:glycosyltransferase family 4 protein n=1 Tax=Streptomyces sp. NPDC092296 TaxID=3366012 RepID=UPI00382AA4B2